MDPIQHLLDEHKDIMAQVADLRAAVRDLEARGDAAVPDALPVLRRIGRMMETQLALHAKKEDEALFPMLEAVLGTGGSPTTVMRMEHKDIHDQGESLRRTLRELNKAEHLAIRAGGAHLHTLTTDSGSSESLRATAEAIIELLDGHFEKEEQVLFPMARQILDEQTLAEVGAKIEALIG